MTNTSLNFGSLDAILARLEVVDLVVYGTETIVGDVVFTGNTQIGNTSADTITINASWPDFTAGSVLFFAGAPVTLRQDNANFSYDQSAHNLTVTKINKLTLTAPANGATVTVVDGKTLTVSDTTTLATNSIAFAGTEVLTLAATKNVTFANAFATSGAFSLTLTVTNTTNATIPAGTVTLVDLASSQALTGKTYNGLTVSTTTGTLTVANAKTVSFADAFTTSGAFSLTLTATNTTNATLPAGTVTLVDLSSSQALTGKTYNGLTLTSTSGTFTLTNAKVFTVSKTLTLDGTDGTTMTFPATSDTLAGLAQHNTFTRAQTITPATSTALILNAQSGTPVGSASAYMGKVNGAAGTVTFITTNQTGNYTSVYLDQDTLVNPIATGTIPIASTLYVNGPPIASTNVTITSAYSAHLAGGITRLDNSSNGAQTLQLLVVNPNSNSSTGATIRFATTTNTGVNSIVPSSSISISDIRSFRWDVFGSPRIDFMGMLAGSATMTTHFSIYGQGATGGAAQVQALDKPARTVAFQTSPQTGDFVTFNLGQQTLTGPSAGTITNVIGLSVAPPLASTNVTATNTIGIQAGAATTIVSDTAATYNALNVPAHTVTITGSTPMTSAQGVVSIAQVTYSNATSSIISAVASLYIANAPTITGGGSITNAYSIWVKGGNTRFDGGSFFGTTTFINSARVSVAGLGNGTGGGISGGSGAVDAMNIPASTITFSNTAQTGNLTALRIGAQTYSNPGSGTIATAIGLNVLSPISGNANTIITDTVALQAGGATTVVSATGATYEAISVPAHTITISGSTAMTTAQGVVTIGQVTYSNATSAIITSVASLYIANAPTVTGGGSITNNSVLWTGAGTVRHDVAASGAGATALHLANTSANTSAAVILRMSTSGGYFTAADVSSSGLDLRVTRIDAGGAAKLDVYVNNFDAGNKVSALTIQPNFIVGSGSNVASFNRPAATLAFQTTPQNNANYTANAFGQVTLTNPSAGTINTGAGMSVVAPLASTNVTITDTVGLLAGGATTVVSATGATYEAISVPAHTVTITGTTPMTSNQGVVSIAQVTYSNATSSIISAVASLYIAAAPTITGGGSIGNAYGLWVAGGATRLGSTLLVNATTTTNNERFIIAPANASGGGSNYYGAINQTAPTINFGGGTAQTGDAYTNFLGAVAYTATTGGSVIPNAATLVVNGAPTASGNASITNAYSIWVKGGLFRNDGNMDYSNGDGSAAVTMKLGTTNGIKFGTATSQKIGFWNATPVVQPTTAIAASTFASNTSGILNDSATWDGYTMGQIVKAMRTVGILA